MEHQPTTLTLNNLSIQSTNGSTTFESISWGFLLTQTRPKLTKTILITHWHKWIYTPTQEEVYRPVPKTDGSLIVQTAPTPANRHTIPLTKPEEEPLHKTLWCAFLSTKATHVTQMVCFNLGLRRILQKDMSRFGRHAILHITTSWNSEMCLLHLETVG